MGEQGGSEQTLAEHQAGRWASVHRVEESQVEAWGTWLGEQWDWDWWMTMTMKDAVGEVGANSRWKAWERWLNRVMECESCDRKGRYARCGRESGVAFELCRYRERGSARAEFVRFSELQRWRGDVPHFHALMVLPWWLKEFRRDRAWEKAFELAGRSRIEPYDPALGARFYTTKYVAKGANVVFSPGLDGVKRALPAVGGAYAA